MSFLLYFHSLRKRPRIKDSNDVKVWEMNDPLKSHSKYRFSFSFHIWYCHKNFLAIQTNSNVFFYAVLRRKSSFKEDGKYSYYQELKADVKMKKKEIISFWWAQRRNIDFPHGDSRKRKKEGLLKQDTKIRWKIHKVFIEGKK